MSAPTPARPSTRQREMMFCHECNDEWYRDERGIICPECGSEFTEIIEDGNDPRDNNMFHGHDEDDDDASMPSLEDTDPHSLLHDHNPFRAHDEDDDPEEEDISQMRFQNTRLQNTGPGTYRITATMSQTIPLNPAALGNNGMGPTGIGGIASFLTNLMQGGLAQPPRPPQQPHEQAESGDGQGGSAPRSGPDSNPNVHRHTFSYTSGARLHPRDSNNPGPRLEPVDELNNVLAGLFAAFGETNPNAPTARGPEPDFPGLPMNPLMGLFAAMSGGQHGDFVTSQEAMDRIVSQLMEQTATNNAPGPAAPSAIEALPRKKVTPDMLGDDGKADCSICMDEVAPDEEVTMLPCKHWFHHQCVAAWLKEHDTCPHCRKGITKEEEADSQKEARRGDMASSSANDPTSHMPGAFGFTGEGTSSNPFVVPGSSPPRGPTGEDASRRAGSNEGRGDEEPSVAEQVRRSWWP